PPLPSVPRAHSVEPGTSSKTEKRTVLPPATLPPGAAPPHSQSSSMFQGRQSPPPSPGRSWTPPPGVLTPGEPTIAEAPSDPRTSPPTLRPSSTTVYPGARRLRPGALFANLFWGALAVAFGASSAAVWWELTVEA